MEFWKYLLSFLLLITYGVSLYFLLDQGDINNLSIPDSLLKQEYDYIVVGAGSAGSVIASRLAQGGFTVLALEAGVSNEVLEVKMPAGFGAILQKPSLKYLTWGNNAKFEKDGYKKEIDFPRGKLVGGCGSINANIWNKGNGRIYNLWDNMGAKGWKYENVKGFFQKAENTLWISKANRYLTPAMRDLIPEAGKLLGLTEINEKQEGFGVYEATVRNGRRWSTADAYLKPTLRKYGDKLHLKLNTTVNKIVFNEKNDRAIGVLLADSKLIKAKKEVIISAGAFNSPAILMRSGIGNSTQLKKFGIKMVKELPGVGQNLQDHPTASFLLRTNESRWDSIKDAPPSITKLLDYMIFGMGHYSSNVAEAGGYLKTKYALFKEVPDIQFHCGAVFFAVPELIREKDKDNRTEDYLGCAVTLATTRDKGSVELKSLDLDDPIEIKLNFLQKEEDLNAMIEGLRMVEKIYKSPTFKGKVINYFPNDEQLADVNKLKMHIYKSLFEVYHPTGTCKMGDVEKDNLAVVDHNLKVKGIENLRVIDASVMPEIANSNTNAPTIMIAEKGANIILTEN